MINVQTVNFSHLPNEGPGLLRNNIIKVLNLNDFNNIIKN